MIIKLVFIKTKMDGSDKQNKYFVIIPPELQKLV